MFNKFYIDKQNLINNIKQAKQKKPNIKICAMVKANAYGVGEKLVAKILNKYVDFWGVACFFEASRLKKITRKKILITGALDINHINPHFSYTCNSLNDVVALSKLNKKINIHLKINTGMNRYGLASVDEFESCLIKLKETKLNLEGVYTHFATTDNFVETQLKTFNSFLALLPKYDLKPIIHADNSHVFDCYSHNFDMARLGFNLYNSNISPYKPVVSISSQIVQINKVKTGQCVGYDKRFVADKNLKVAVLPVGYADGFDMKNIGLKLTVDGKKCKVLNICMDCFMLDITKTKLKKGDKVYILNQANPLSLYAKHQSTSEYEIMCKFNSLRADRIIINN